MPWHCTPFPERFVSGVESEFIQDEKKKDTGGLLLTIQPHHFHKHSQVEFAFTQRWTLAGKPATPHHQLPSKIFLLAVTNPPLHPQHPQAYSPRLTILSHLEARNVDSSAARIAQVIYTSRYAGQPWCPSQAPIDRHHLECVTKAPGAIQTYGPFFRHAAHQRT